MVIHDGHLLRLIALHIHHQISFLVVSDDLAQLDVRIGRVEIHYNGIAPGCELLLHDIDVLLRIQEGLVLRELVELSRAIELIIVKLGLFPFLAEIVTVELIVLFITELIGLFQVNDIIHTCVDQELPDGLIVVQEGRQLLHHIDIAVQILEVKQTVHTGLDRIVLTFEQVVLKDLLVNRRLCIELSGIRLLLLGSQVTIGDRLCRCLIVGIGNSRIAIAYQQLLVLIIHKLTPSVGGALQEVIETLVILHEIREQMLRTRLVAVFILGQLDVLHVGIIEIHRLCRIIRQLIVLDLILQDVLAQLLRDERTAVVLLKSGLYILKVTYIASFL